MLDEQRLTNILIVLKPQVYMALFPIPRSLWKGELTLARIAGLTGVLGLMLTLIVSAIWAYSDRQRRFERAKQDAETEAFFLSDHASRLFEVSKVGLSTTGRIIASRSWDDISVSPEIYAQLYFLANSLPYAEDIWLNDETGQLRATSFAFPSPLSTAADRENFKAAAQSDRDLFIGPRIIGRVTRRPTFLVSQRLEYLNGQFRGMASITIDLHYFRDYWAKIKPAEGTRITLIRSKDGGVVAQYPEDSAAGDGLSAPLPPSLETSGPFTTSDNQRFGVSHQVSNLPLYLSVDMSRKIIVAEWQMALLRGLPIALIALLTFATLTVLAWRQALIESRAATALQDANRELRLEIKNREQAEEQMRQMQKMEAVGQLTGGLAHDFNNMLAIIMGSLGQIQRRIERGNMDIARFLANALEGAQRAASLTQRLLAFARRQPLSPQTIDANKFIAGLSDLLRRTLPEAIKIETVLAEGLWQTRADASQLENSLLNLAVNARDAMPQGGTLRIEASNIRVRQDDPGPDTDIPVGDYVLISVSDTGVGMSPEVMSKAFDPFFTTKSLGRGTGLGLSQVYGFVHQTGGHVQIRSAPGQGTSLKIYLPRHDGPVPDRPAPDRPGILPTEALVPLGTTLETVLVVEDDDPVRQISVDTLRDLGYSVLHARSAKAALEILTQNHGITLLFTDVVMPEMNGRQLADEAQKLQPGIKILFTTGYAPDAVVHDGVLDPGVKLLSKPFSFEQLARAVRQALEDESI